MCSMISRKRKTIFKLRPNIVPTRSTIRGTVSQGYRAPGAPRSSPSTTSSSLISSLGAGAWKGRVRSSRAPNLTPWFQTHCWISPNQTLLFVTKESVPKKSIFHQIWFFSEIYSETNKTVDLKDDWQTQIMIWPNWQKLYIEYINSFNFIDFQPIGKINYLKNVEHIWDWSLSSSYSVVLGSHFIYIMYKVVITILLSVFRLSRLTFTGTIFFPDKAR